MDLKMIRKNAGLTQAQVSKKLKIHRSTYIRVEQGISSLKLEHLDQLAKIYNLNKNLIYAAYKKTKEKKKEGI